MGLRRNKETFRKSEANPPPPHHRPIGRVFSPPKNCHGQKGRKGSFPEITIPLAIIRTNYFALIRKPPSLRESSAVGPPEEVIHPFRIINLGRKREIRGGKNLPDCSRVFYFFCRPFPESTTEKAFKVLYGTTCKLIRSKDRFFIVHSIIIINHESFSA